MTDIKKAQAVGALRECAKEHEKDFTPTFNIRVSDLCFDVNNADYLEELEKENNSIKQILINLVTAFNNYECAGPEQEQENTWETLRDLMHEELLKIEKGNK